jgi:hypothetical protein
MMVPAARPDWLTAMRRYVVAAAVGNAAWETAQMPLYTLWQSGTSRQIAVAVLHCTAGDALIAAGALLMALLLAGSQDWPRTGHARIGVVAIAAGVVYTIYSEYLNIAVRGAWAYSGLMPTLPWLEIGLAPLAQWLVVPPLALVWAMRSQRGARTTDGTSPSSLPRCSTSLL